jgi:glutamate formiminotransferase
LTTTLLAYPNVSEGRDRATIDRIGQAFSDALLDVHSDADHHRSAYTLAGQPGELARAVVSGAREAVDAIHIDTHDGVHPRVGAVDVAPIIYLSDEDRGAAAAEALVLADTLATDLHLPVFLYGVLAGGRTRAELRRGGPAELQRRIDDGEAGLRAIGLWLAQSNLAQVSTNVEDHRATPLRAVVEAVTRHAPVAGAELVGLAPEAALQDFPPDIPLRGYATIEQALHRRAHTA